MYAANSSFQLRTVHAVQAVQVDILATRIGAGADDVGLLRGHQGHLEFAEEAAQRRERFAAFFADLQREHHVAPILEANEIRVKVIQYDSTRSAERNWSRSYARGAPNGVVVGFVRHLKSRTLSSTTWLIEGSIRCRRWATSSAQTRSWRGVSSSHHRPASASDAPERHAQATMATATRDVPRRPQRNQQPQRRNAIASQPGPGT